MLIIASGCGREAAHTPTTRTDVPLPEWAAENPSPEFIRAARVLKPIPPEFLGAWGEAAGPAAQATLARFRRTWTAGYEFFGAMTDEQIERFVSTKKVRIPVGSLTPKQRAALDNYFDVWREAMAGTGLGADDLLVALYKDGAREDLSNMGVGFVWGGTEDDPGVNLQFWITLPDGSVSTPSNSVAMM
jgi:hypothetical protein